MEKQFHITKINNHVVKPIPKKKGAGKDKPVKGADIFSIYCNIYLCSKKKSGKTSLLYNIIKECTTKNTTIIAFCSTLYKDDSWQAIMDYCEQKDIPFIGHTSLMDDEVSKLDKLSEIVKHLKQKADEPEEEEPKAKQTISIFDNAPKVEEDDELKRKPSRSKWAVAEYFFIFDDLSMELKRSESVVSLLKDSRHLHAKVLISSQAWTDVPKNGRGSFDYLILFRGISDEKLNDIYEENAISTITVDEFKYIYHMATKERYQFLYFDKDNETFRRNFNLAIDFKDE